MKKHTFFLLASLFLFLAIISSCKHDKHSHNHNHSGHEFTDKHSVEELVQRFESPERDSIQQPQKVLAYLGDIEGKTIMDIGAGTGYFSVKFADKGANVIAADVSDEFQKFLKRRINENKIRNIELRKTPYDNPLLKNDEVDIAFIANTYHHIENRIAYFSKVKKGLKKDGELVVVDFFDIHFPEGVTAPPEGMKVSIDQAVDELKKSGFSSFDVEVNMMPYQYILRAK